MRAVRAVRAVCARCSLTRSCACCCSSPMLNPIEKGFRSVQSYMQAHYQEAESNPYAVLQNGFASVTQKSGRAHFRAMREAMATM